MHTPVLLKDVIAGLKVQANGWYIDATVGEGGHLKEILRRGGRVLGIDWDENQVKNAKSRLRQRDFGGQVKVVQGNFADIREIAKSNDFFPVDGILLDLGLSYEQIEKSGKGFSYKRSNEKLDMRLSQDVKIKAVDLINKLNQKELYEIFAKNSEEVNSWAIAKAIVSARNLKRIIKVGDLIAAIKKAVPRASEQILARIFQALRMEVNSELKNLTKGLAGGLEILKEGGRLLVISFHSVEDRVVKRFIKENKQSFSLEELIKGKKALKYERSAKLRIIEKK